MALDLEQQARVSTLQQQVAKHQEKLTAAIPPPPTGPLFVKLPDGSVNTRAGVQVRGPIERPPAKPAKPGA